MSDRPVLLCPFAEAAIHPDAEAMARRSLEWVREHKLLPDESSSSIEKVHSYSLLAARCYPSAPFARLAAICDYISWLFLFDDICEGLSLDGASPGEVSAFLTGIFGVLWGAPGPGPASARFVEALGDIWERIGPLCSETWRNRLIRHVENYIDGCTWEAQNRTLRRVPSRAVFQQMRLFTSTMYEFWDFIEYAGGFCLPDEVVEHPIVAELSRTANAVASYANDIYSLRKEAENRDFHNLVVVIEHEEHIGRPAAYARAAAIHDVQARHYLALEPLVPSFGPEVDRTLGRYMEGMRIWMRANYDWSCVTIRYNAAPQARPG